LDLLQSFSGELDFVVGRLLRLLDKGVEHYYALPDEEAVERPTNTGPAARSQLKQTIAESSRIRQLQVGAMLDEQLNNSRVIRENVNGPRFDHGLHSGMKILNRKCHE
jgi:hypothetical protein